AQGAVLIDADAIAREVVAPGTQGLVAVTEAFGAGVLRPDGALDRGRPGQIVFAAPAKLGRLHQLLHPLVRPRTPEVEQDAGAGAIVVPAGPLLAANRLSAGYDLVIVVDAPEHIQLERLVKQRGMSQEQAEARMAAQVSRDDRLAIADLVVDNSSSLAELDRQVGDLSAELRRRERVQAAR